MNKKRVKWLRPRRRETRHMHFLGDPSPQLVEQKVPTQRELAARRKNYKGRKRMGAGSRS